MGIFLSQKPLFYSSTKPALTFQTDVVEYAGVDVAGTQTATGIGPHYNNRTDPFDKVTGYPKM